MCTVRVRVRLGFLSGGLVSHVQLRKGRNECDTQQPSIGLGLLGLHSFLPLLSHQMNPKVRSLAGMFKLTFILL